MSDLAIMRLLRTRRCKLSDMATFRQGGTWACGRVVRPGGDSWPSALQKIPSHWPTLRN